MPRYLPRNPFPSYGISDLDPLGGLHNPGGGMIYDPMRVGSGRRGNLPGYGFGIYYFLFDTIFANNVNI